MSRVFHVGPRIIHVLSSDLVFLHPAIDVKNGVAYVGVWLPVKIGEPREDDFDNPSEIHTDYDFFLVTSERKLYYIGCGQEAYRNAAKLGFYLSTSPFRHKKPRWRVEHVMNWLENPEPIDPKEAYNTVYQTLTHYIEFQDESEAAFLALWIIGTYFLPIWKAYPYVYVGGVKRVGKTKLLTLVQLMAFNGLNSVSISTASIFRLCEALSPTICFDETEKLHEADRLAEWRAIILGGYKRGAGEAFRVEGERVKRPKSYTTFSPKIFANISGIEDVLEDRTIPLILLRGLNREVLNREPDVESDVWPDIRNILYRLFLENFDSVCSIYAVCSVSLNDINLDARERELWLPIFALVEWLEQKGVKNLRGLIKAFAERVLRQKNIEDMTENIDMLLLQTLLENVAQDDFVRVDDVKKWLMEALGEEAPKFINNKWVGRALKRLGLTEKRKVGRYSEVRISPAKLQALQLRYLKNYVTEQTEQTPQTEQTEHETYIGLHRLQVRVNGKCENCGVEGPMDYQVNHLDNSWGLLCMNCGEKLMQRFREEVADE